MCTYVYLFVQELQVIKKNISVTALGSWHCYIWINLPLCKEMYSNASEPISAYLLPLH